MKPVIIVSNKLSFYSIIFPPFNRWPSGWSLKQYKCILSFPLRCLLYTSVLEIYHLVATLCITFWDIAYAVLSASSILLEWHLVVTVRTTSQNEQDHIGLHRDVRRYETYSLPCCLVVQSIYRHWQNQNPYLKSNISLKY